MDKFDAMMKVLRAQETYSGEFRQLIAVDREFELFQRAWCVAEIVEAHRRHIPQFLQVPSSQDICEKYDTIRGLDVDNCRASRPEDEVYLKKKIELYSNSEAFNRELRKLLAGIAFQWMHMRQVEMEEIILQLAYTSHQQE